MSRALDPLRDADGFDFVADLGAIMPMRTIGYLLGIPEEGQQQIRDRNDKSITVASQHEGAGERQRDDHLTIRSRCSPNTSNGGRPIRPMT